MSGFPKQVCDVCGASKVKHASWFVATPDARGPRNCGQSSAKMGVTRKVEASINRNMRGFREERSGSSASLESHRETSLLN